MKVLRANRGGEGNTRVGKGSVGSPKIRGPLFWAPQIRSRVFGGL